MKKLIAILLLITPMFGQAKADNSNKSKIILEKKTIAYITNKTPHPVQVDLKALIVFEHPSLMPVPVEKSHTSVTLQPSESHTINMSHDLRSMMIESVEAKYIDTDKGDKISYEGEHAKFSPTGAIILIENNSGKPKISCSRLPLMIKAK